MEPLLGLVVENSYVDFFVIISHRPCVRMDVWDDYSWKLTEPPVLDSPFSNLTSDQPMNHTNFTKENCDFQINWPHNLS